MLGMKNASYIQIEVKPMRADKMPLGQVRFNVSDEESMRKFIMTIDEMFDNFLSAVAYDKWDMSDELVHHPYSHLLMTHLSAAYPK